MNVITQRATLGLILYTIYLNDWQPLTAREACNFNQAEQLSSMMYRSHYNTCIST